MQGLQGGVGVPRIKAIKAPTRLFATELRETVAGGGAMGQRGAVAKPARNKAEKHGKLRGGAASKSGKMRCRWEVQGVTL